jgi:hypothetical protein
MDPDVVVTSRQLMRIFPAGEAKYPERDIDVFTLVAMLSLAADAITVVPSQSSVNLCDQNAIIQAYRS